MRALNGRRKAGREGRTTQIVYFVIGDDPSGNEYSSEFPDESSAHAYQVYLEGEGWTHVRLIAEEVPTATAAPPQDGCAG